MIKENELWDYKDPIRYQDGEAVTLMTIQTALTEAAANFAIPVAFKNDQIKSGGLFNSATEDCLVMYHPEHEKDYLQFCIRVQHQGIYAIVNVNRCGQSKQLDKAYRSEIAKQGVKDYVHAKDDMATGQAVGRMIGGALGSIGKSKKKLDEEKTYYDYVDTIFNDVLS